MQAATAGVRGPITEVYKVREMQLGANWFFWVAILGVINSAIVYYFGLPSLFFGLGTTQYVDSQMVASGPEAQRVAGLAINLGIAGVIASFGYLTRKGGDVAFIVGMFLYVFDSVIALGYRDFFSFGFHMFALFFMFKGLLASRRRYDPSVDYTGA
ncbi:MAG: hypothetical protein ABIR33_09685 [Pyrinomonadaceae bacterium]